MTKLPVLFFAVFTVHCCIWPSLSQPSVSEGYIGKECRGNSFIAGTITSLDCDNITTRNQAPTA